MEKKPELLVIDPGIIRPEIETFNLVSRLCAIPVTYHLPALEGMESIWEAERTGTCVGAVLLGSSASVREQRDWQVEIIDWVRNKMSPTFPILGICYGHQLLAYMHGAPVVEVGKKHVGFRNVKVKKDERLKIEDQEVPLFVLHGDKVDAIPKDFELFASSDVIPIDGLRHKKFPIWSFQPHVDATAAFAVNCSFTEKDKFPQLASGNALLKKFLDYLMTQIPPSLERRHRGQKPQISYKPDIV